MKYFFILLSSIFFMSCASKKVANSNSNELLDAKWQILEISGVTIKDKVNGKVPYLIFDKENDRYSVITGCNTLNGEFVLKQSELKFGNGMSTMMFCEDMSVEDGFKSILSKVDSYEIKDGELMLKSSNKVLAKLKEYTVIEQSSLVGTTWELNLLAEPGVDFDKLFADKKPTISFLTDGKVSGNSACNNYNTTYQIESNDIRFGNIMSTKMMCPNIKAEDAYLSTLAKVNRFSYSGNELTFIIGDIAVMRFVKK